jgi:hypothetical protein
VFKTVKTHKLKTGAKLSLLILFLLLTQVSLVQAIMPPWFQAAGAAQSGTGAVSPAWPAHQIDDIALLFVESAGGQAATLSTLAGFVAVLNSPQATGAGTAGTRITVFWARATSAAMATPTVADPGDHVYAQIITYRGIIATGDPWDVTGGGVKAVASTSVTVTGVTTTVADTLIVQTVARDNDSAAAGFSAQTNANLTGIAERSDAGTNSGNGGGLGVWDGVMAAAGTTGNSTATVTSSINAFLTIALKPPPAMATIYAINNNAAAIQRINPANSAATTVYTGAPFPLATRAAGLAQCPNGMLYFINQTGTLYRFNPNTPAVAPAAIGNTTIDMIRMTCHPTTGVLYGMPSAVNNLNIINTTTAATTAIPLTLPGITPPANGSGDIGFDVNGTLHFVGEGTAGNAATVRLWIINLATNTFENLGAVTGLPNVANGIAFDNSGNVLLSLTGQTRLYAVSADGGAATPIGAINSMPAVYDLSSGNVLLFTKTNNSAFSPGVPFTYSVVLTAGAVVNNAVFIDPAVANLNVSNVTCAAAGGAVCPVGPTVAGMQGAGLTIPFMPVGGSVTFTITANVTGNPTGMLTNTSSVTLSGQTNSASDTDAIKKVLITRWREVY